MKNRNNYQSLINMQENDKLMEQARKMYPVGTKFIPAHISREEGVWCVITSDSELKWNGGGLNITSMVNGKAWLNANRARSDEYGNTEYNRCVYHNGKWAKRLDSLPATEPKQLPIFN